MLTFPRVIFTRK